MPKPSFTRTVIGELNNDVGQSPFNTLFNVGDIDADGRPDIVVAGREGLIAWFENPGDRTPWKRRVMAESHWQECGGIVHDLTGDGYPDLINGGDWRLDELAWWQNPGAAGGDWKRRIIAKTGATQFHDELIGDVTGDGRLTLVFGNQRSAGLCIVPIPDDPFQSPWPGMTVIAPDVNVGGQPEEGLAIADIDGDGHNEIIAGTHWYKYKDGVWYQFQYAADYITTLVAVGDIDGDGQLEIVLSEGDACIYGRPEGGRLGWFKPGKDIRALWTEHKLDEHLLDPHSLQLGSLCGSGRLDILVGEIGVAETIDTVHPRLFVYKNEGGGRFTRHLIDEGVGTHHARLVDLTGNGLLDIASRPLHGPDKWKIFAWYNEG